ncbi:MAG: flavin reductase [Acidimicrobiales bacterium]|nr:flavin reductase [Acidimicrobiales bacterium]
MKSESVSDDFDRLRRRIFWAMPSGIYLIGSCYENAVNLMTINWVTQISSQPKIVVAGIEKSSHTMDLIEKSNKYSLNFIQMKDKVLARTYAKAAVVDIEEMRLSGNKFYFTESLKVPVLESAVAYFEVSVISITNFSSHNAVFGEVVGGEIIDESLKESQGELSSKVLKMSDTKMHYGG